jgi:hypothetical protein
MDREEILQKAIDLTKGERNSAHGDPRENHERIAKIWSVQLGVEINGAQVALMMAGMKLARLAYKYSDDSFIDAAAYIAIAGEIR